MESSATFETIDIEKYRMEINKLANEKFGVGFVKEFYNGGGDNFYNSIHICNVEKSTINKLAEHKATINIHCTGGCNLHKPIKKIEWKTNTVDLHKGIFDIFRMCCTQLIAELVCLK